MTLKIIDGKSFFTFTSTKARSLKRQRNERSRRKLSEGNEIEPGGIIIIIAHRYLIPGNFSV